MQTWLPYPDFRRSLECLDMRRLNAQCGEALQLLQGTRPTHPARFMWLGYEESLATYRNTAVAVWVLRRDGGPHTRQFCRADGTVYGDVVSVVTAEHWLAAAGMCLLYLAPPWLGDERFHAAHQARLLSKEYSVYQEQFSLVWQSEIWCECGRQDSCHVDGGSYWGRETPGECPDQVGRTFMAACPWPELDGRGGYHIRWGFRKKVGGPIHYVHDDHLTREAP